MQGRPIRLHTLGHGPSKVLFIGGIHGDEPECAVATAELPAVFEAAGLADESRSRSWRTPTRTGLLQAERQCQRSRRQPELSSLEFRPPTLRTVENR